MAALTIQHKLYDDEGEEEMVTLPAKYEVCGRCRGTGKHVNPAIDGHGLSREDFDEDPDFEEAYFSGFYDVTCYECSGDRVVLVEDESAFTEEHKAIMERLEAKWDDDAAYAAECRAERMMGA